MTLKRSRYLVVIFSVLLVAILVRIFSLQIFAYRYYQNKVIDQITAGSLLKAPRGNIYDRNGVLLATDKTAYRIYISPVDILSQSKKDGTDYGVTVARGLSEILSLDYEKIYKKTQTRIMDETIARNADDATKKAVLQFANENGLTAMIHAEATTSRYYPMGTLASHVLGFTGSDNQGLFGIEAYYDNILTGTDGQYITLRDATSKVPEDGYASYIEAVKGSDVVTTIDVYIQRELELQLSAALLNADAQNRVTGAVMNVNTGEIYAMATLPSYDPNAPYTLDAVSEQELARSGYGEGTQEYKKLRSTLLYEMWNNKMISEIYEPGSTFKIITCATALDLGVVKESNVFSCPGYHKVGGYRIACHKRTGHGSPNFAQGLQQSCNPAMMQIAERIGTEAFYRYYKAFGYLTKTEIDLPSEAVGIFHEEGSMGSTELATASFGQRFKVSPIQQLTAVATVANGGTPVTPHIFSCATDSEKNVTVYKAPDEKEKILNERTCKTICRILEEGVSGNGGAKNAYVAGYKVAAKTGTSEKFDVLDENGRSYLRVGSCVAFAPSDDAEVAVIIIVDEPTCQNKYGSMTAAPYVSALLENILPYLGHQPVYQENEVSATVKNYEGLPISDAVKLLKNDCLSYEIIGTGKTVVSQAPDQNSKLYTKTGKVILYTTEESEYVTVPDLIGKTAEEANRILVNSGLNVSFSGAMNYTLGSGAVVLSQSVPSGTSVKRGSVITVHALHSDSAE